MIAVLFDIGIPGGMTTVAAGAGVFLLIAAMAYVIFRLLRKTVRMAFRMAVVATVLFTFVVGGIALYWFGYGTTARPAKPEPARRR